MQINTSQTKIVAALGPTNTGKTFLAFERMLGHSSGMIGFPLRLLARENYERALALKGRGSVALITGEEKIIPPYAKYFFCTVESMPINKTVSFLGIDEIQMCSDSDRGHIFTNRLLHARGREETMFMGSESIAPLIKKLVPEVQITSRYRFSSLTYSGLKNISRLPPRTAVVGFTAADVYAIAELIRRQRGGAAIVMGALSPRTRNAQVALFQNGDVDYLVATDAIGMGLNMDVNHVAFASIKKFDGKVRRELRSDELGQISGRAGRYMSNGTFGVTGNTAELAPEVVEAIEGHVFDPLKFIYWRNPNLDYSDIESLFSSLNRVSDQMFLTKIQEPDDERFLRQILSDPEIFNSVKNSNEVRLLWDVCQVPDYKKGMGINHARFLGQLFKHLRRTKHLPVDWIAGQVRQLDVINGDIENLVARIAGIRLWTYIAHRNDWLKDPIDWQEKTREVEDRLSDALHKGLTQRFVDRRTSTLVKRLKHQKDMSALVNAAGEVLVEGYFVGKLVGFQFYADESESKIAGKALKAAAFRALGREVVRRTQKLLSDNDETFSVSNEGKIVWRGDAVARLVKGNDPLRPRILMNPAELIEKPAREKIEERLNKWFGSYVGIVLKPLFRIKDAQLGPGARGFAFQLIEGLGVLSRKSIGKQMRVLTSSDFSKLRRYGVKVGREEIFISSLLKPRPAALAALLWAVFIELKTIPAPPLPGRVSLPIYPDLSLDFYRVAGFRPIGPILLRVDILERLRGQIGQLGSKGPFAVSTDLLSLAGCTTEDMDKILRELGYRGKENCGQVLYQKSQSKLRKRQKHQQRGKFASVDKSATSPFAKLKDLMVNP